MIRKLSLLLILFTCLFSKVQAASGDSVTISIPPYTDTTCIGGQNLFFETDTFTGATVKWFANGVFTGVTIDTFHTTDLNDGDSVYCWIYLSPTDSARSNAIVVHKLASFPARVLTSITVGSNPDCAGHPLTFLAYPINGGANPQYQWFVNGTELAGEDSISITRVFGGADTVYCRMVADTFSCSPIDTVFSIPVPIIHIHLTASVTVFPSHLAICEGAVDTFTAIASDYGASVTYQWYVDSILVPGAVNSTYITDSLNNNDSVYVVITTTDTCVLNPVTASNIVGIPVYHVYGSFAHINLTAGANPGCLDSPVTFTAVFDTFGTGPTYEWYINGVMVNSMMDTITRNFNNNDIVTFKVRETDGGCYTNDSIAVPGVIMVRDSTPATPRVSLIGNMLVVNGGTGTYRWYHDSLNSYVNTTLIPGATGPTYHPTTLGYYFVVKDSSNCPSMPSNIIYISLLKVDNISKSSVEIYPNPTTGILSLDWGGQKVNMKMDVYNATGTGLLHYDIENSAHFDTDLSVLPDGNYFIVLRDENGDHSTYGIHVNRN